MTKERKLPGINFLNRKKKLPSRLIGTNPRALGTNPRALGTNPRSIRKLSNNEVQ
jgi:hypothetical protein